MKIKRNLVIHASFSVIPAKAEIQDSGFRVKHGMTKGVEMTLSNMSKIKIDEEKCIGCGSCVAVCPESFEMDKDNKAYLKEGKDTEKCIQEAIDICPVHVIEIEE